MNFQSGIFIWDNIPLPNDYIVWSSIQLKHKYEFGLEKISKLANMSRICKFHNLGEIYFGFQDRKIFV